MSTYHFYYDESGHSRKINYETISATNYYDNFVSVIVGWPKRKEQAVFEKYSEFESKYAERKDKNGELKSTTIKPKQLEFGFGSLNEQNVKFLDDFLSLYDREISVYFSAESKIEYLVLQLFQEYENTILFDADAMKYSITKALVEYRPEKVIKCIYDTPELFVDVLKEFFRERVECNNKNPKLKATETKAFKEILSYLDSVSVIPELQWDYRMPFDGFKKYLREKGIYDYSLIIDKEGEIDQESRTLRAAHQVGLNNAKEADSKNSYGLRMADMMVGIITKLLKSLCDSLRYHSLEEGTTKKLLDIRWFQMSESQLNLYKKLHKIICEMDHAWFKTYGGIYSDDLILFIALLNFMNHFESIEAIQGKELELQSEYFNGFACEQLSDYFDRRKSKLPIEPIENIRKDFFFNQRGAKVYFDTQKQPNFPISKGKKIIINVLSVGLGNKGVPLITTLENGCPVCYRLPQELSNWAYTVICMANMGVNTFPAQIAFSCVGGRYYADIV